MGDKTKIEWADSTWPVVTGCSVLTEGCTNCYAMQMAGTRLKNVPAYEGLTRMSGGRPKWTGEMRFNEKASLQPMKWKKPRKIFVCSMADLFHENVDDAWIDRVFAVMALCPQHTFQILTKRPERMRQYMSAQKTIEGGKVVSDASWCVERHANDIAVMGGTNVPWRVQTEVSDAGRYEGKMSWPLKNVWLGTSVENQAAAEERIPILLDTPAAVRFISAEPLLGPITLERTWLAPDYQAHETTQSAMNHTHVLALVKAAARKEFGWAGLDWTIVGGESGPRARPMHPDWVRSLRDQCTAADVPLMFKQWGEWYPPKDLDEVRGVSETFIEALIMEGDVQTFRVGKKRAGRMLDGREWDQYPETAA